MFRKKVVIVLYETTGTEGNGIGSIYIWSRLYSYGSLFDKLYEMLTNKYGTDSLIIKNVIKL